MVGAVLSVGLGCEYTQPSKLAEVVHGSGRPTEWFFIQESGGTSKSVARPSDVSNTICQPVPPFSMGQSLT